MHVPRIVKILIVAVILFAAWQFLRSGHTIIPTPSAPENKETGVRPTAPLEVFADSVIHQIYPNATLVMHHGSPVGDKIAYFMYYRPVPSSPDAIISYLRSSGAEIQRSVSGQNWYVSAILSKDGSPVTMDFYPDYEKNALVVMVR